MSLRFHVLPSLSLGALYLGVLGVMTTVAHSAPLPWASLPWAQDVDQQLERAKGRITEMFCLRLELQLADLAQASGAPLDSAEDAKQKAREAVNAWLKEHPVKLQDQGPISWNSTPIEYAPFREFEVSEAWRTARSSVLTGPQIAFLDARNAERTEKVIAALTRIVQMKVTESLCLSEPEQVAIDDVCRRAAEKLFKAGVIESLSNIFYSNDAPKEMIREALDEESLLAALPPHRRSIVEEMLRKGRSERHSYQLQAEYYLHGEEDVDAQRKLLYGLADALVHREGGEEKRESQVFVKPGKLGGEDDWTSALQGLLKLEAAPETPEFADKNSRQDLRTEFLLAVLDERACFTADQRESLQPLMKEFVQNERFWSRNGSDPELLFPQVLGLSEDGLLIPGDNNRFNRPSTKVLALVKTLYEVCTQAQSDVLKS